MAIGAGILGGAYLLSQRGNADAAAPALALPGSNLTAPAVTAPAGPLAPLNIRIEAPTVTLPALPQVAAAVEQVKEVARRVYTPRPPGFSFNADDLPRPPGSFLPDLSGGEDGGTSLLDRAAERAAELVRADAIKSAFADWKAGQAARDAVEALDLKRIADKAKELARVDDVLDRFYEAKETARVDNILDSFYAAKDAAKAKVLDLAPDLDDLGGLGDAIQLAQGAAGFVDFVSRTLGPRAWREGFAGYRYHFASRVSQPARWLANAVGG